MAWQQTSENENGNVWENTADGLMAFEDLQDTPCWYAWRGTWEDHDTAEPSPCLPTLSEAVAALSA